MKKNFLSKCIITLGLFLFFTLLLPLTSYNNKTALAGSIENETYNDYRLKLTSITLVKGNSFTLKAYNLSENAKVSFKSADSEIASVNEDGTITANKVGVTIITATIKEENNSTNLTCDITVGPPAFSVKITKSRIILGLGKNVILRVILKPSNTAEDAKFSSHDTDIASIRSGGYVTAKNLGFTYLFAEIDVPNSDGRSKFAKSSIIVTSPEDAPLLEAYFNEHPELDLIFEDDLSTALEKFFNGKSEKTVTQATQSSLVDELNQYLEKEFDLTALRK